MLLRADLFLWLYARCTVTSSSVNACLEAARKMDAPIIIQFSSGGSQFYAGKGLDNTDYKAAIAGAVSGAFHVRAMAEQYLSLIHI